MALYHKYRPTTFDQIIGQPQVTTTFRNMIARGWINHAYLFMGPRGTGKTTAARVVAKAVNCLGENKPCDKCDSCKKFNSGSLDLIEIDAASNTGVDMVRETIRDNVHFAPSEATYKVYVVDEAHMLSKPANNALLKTLEEPPPHVIFILVTTEPWKLMPTIVSRCQLHQFRLVSLDEILSLLDDISAKEGFRCDRGALQLIARQAHGCVRDAVMLLDQMSVYDYITEDRVRNVLGLGDDKYMYELLEGIASSTPGKSLDAIHHAIDNGVELGQFVDQTLDFLHEALMFRLGSLDIRTVSDIRLRACRDLNLGVQDIVKAVESLADAKQSMQYIAPEIALSMEVAGLCPTLFAPPLAAPNTFVTTKELPTVEIVKQKEDPLKDPLVVELIAMGAEVVGVWD